MKKYFTILVIILVVCLCGKEGIAQKFIRLDKINTAVTKKFYIGQNLHFTTKEYPDVWRVGTISNLDFDTQSIVFHNDLLVIRQIGKIRTFKPWAHSLGINLYRFSAAWFVFGGVIHATTDFKVDYKTAVIGSSALALGLILDKLLYKKTHKLSSRWKLRVLDTNF